VLIFARAPSRAAVAASSVPRRPIDDVLQLLDFAACHDVGVALVQLFLGLQFVDGLLQGALGLLDLALRPGEIRLGDDRRGVDLDDLAPRDLQSRLLLGAVQAQDPVSPLHLAADPDIGLRYPADPFRQDGKGAKITTSRCSSRGGCRRPP
jgi:hypothetical protein